MYQLYIKIIKINEKRNTIFISPVNLTYDFYITLNNVMQVKGLYSVCGCFDATI